MSIEDQLLRAQEQLHAHVERIRNQRAEIMRLTKERDAARIDREDLRKALIGWVDAAEKFASERDEARKAARILMTSAEMADDNLIAVQCWPWLEETK